MANRSTAHAIDEYIAGFPPETQTVLEEMRALIRASAPGATETISYAIPTFDLNGKHLVHFAGYAQHVGLYPAPSGLGKTFRIATSLPAVSDSVTALVPAAWRATSHSPRP